MKEYLRAVGYAMITIVAVLFGMGLVEFGYLTAAVYFGLTKGQTAAAILGISLVAGAVKTARERRRQRNRCEAMEKPEFLGPGLQSSSLTITLSSALGVRPRTVLEEIENMVETGTAERLVIGTRPVGKNPVRLTGSSETWDVIYNRGELARATMTITLEEYT